MQPHYLWTFALRQRISCDPWLFHMSLHRLLHRLIYGRAKLGLRYLLLTYITSDAPFAGVPVSTWRAQDWVAFADMATPAEFAISYLHLASERREVTSRGGRDQTPATRAAAVSLESLAMAHRDRDSSMFREVTVERFDTLEIVNHCSRTSAWKTRSAARGLVPD